MTTPTQQALEAAEAFIAKARRDLYDCHSRGINGIPEDDLLGLQGLAEIDEVLDKVRAALAAQPELRDAYVGAREDLAIWKRRALGAERDLRKERVTNARLVADINSASGPVHLGEPAAQPDCLTCSDHGAVGNMLDAEPCPDCTPHGALEQPELPEPLKAECEACFGTGVEGDADDYGNTISVQCGSCEGTGKTEVYTAAQLQQAVEQAQAGLDDWSVAEFKPSKHYAERDHMAMDREGGYFFRHMSAMTGEGLHSKSHIAAELAWRDIEIDRLQAQAKREPMTRKQRDLLIRDLHPANFDDGDKWDDALIEAVEVHHNIGAHK